MKKTILTFLLVLLFSGIIITTSFAAKEQTITMKIEVAQRLNKTIGVSSSNGATINWGDETSSTVEAGTLVEVSHIYSGTGVKTITISGVEITEINAAYNEITEVDLSDISTLVNANFSGNKLTSLNLSGNSDLTELNCANNSLENLALASFNNLTVLKCGNNKISSLTIPSGILELDIQNNKLATFDFSAYTLLKKLNCKNNELKEINLDNNTKIAELICSNNNLQTLELTNNTEIVTLDCSNNNISGINLNSLTKLVELKVFENLITSLDITNNSSLKKVLLDSDVVVTGSVDTIIKIEIIGSGNIEILDNNVLMYPSYGATLERILLNDVEQDITKTSLDISSCTKENTLKISFSSLTNKNSVKVNSPDILDGMIPVKHNGENWVITIPEDPEWYDYSPSSKKWANVMLKDGAKYIAGDGTLVSITDQTTIESLVGREISNENKGSMYVWIPRYSYEITSGNIDIKYSDGLNDVTFEGYIVHPAFNYLDEKLDGFWVAKYQASGSDGNVKYNGLGAYIDSFTINTAFNNSKTSKLPESANAISHLIKNTEWGAVSYLTNFVGTATDTSTTGNEYGIYDMTSGAEFVSSYIELVGGISNYNVRKNGKDLIYYTKDDFNKLPVEIGDIDIIRLTNPLDNSEKNKERLANYKGIGINELEGYISGVQSIPTGENAFFIRGIDNIYSYQGSNGEKGPSFRNIILKNVSNSGDDNKREYFTINSSCKGSGKISPLGNTVVQKNGSVTFYIKPELEARIVDVKIDGISVSIEDNLEDFGVYKTYTFSNVTENHTIFVEFKTDEDSEVVITVESLNSRVYIIATPGETIGVDAIIKDGYTFNGWTVEGITIDDTTSLNVSFVVPNNNVRLVANYSKAINQYELTVENPNSKVSSMVNEKEEVTVNATIIDGYTFTGWSAEGIDLGDKVDNESITFNMPSNDVRLVANYSKNPIETYLLTVENFGVVTKEEKELNTPVTITVTDVDGYIFIGWTIEGVEVADTSGKTISFNMPNNDVHITANYSENEETNIFACVLAEFNDDFSSVIIKMNDTYSSEEIEASDKLFIVGDENGVMRNYSDSNKSPMVENKSTLTSFSIEAGVASIGNYTFYGCSGLTGALVIPEGVTSIGSSAFEKCSGLTGDLVIPEGVTSIGSFAFADCDGLTGALVIPEGVTSIGSSAFEKCSGLTGDLVIPEGVTSIGSFAFADCDGLTSIVIPESVTIIREWAFTSCDVLTSIKIPEGVTSIGEGVFAFCSNLTSIKIPDGVTSIGKQAFCYCRGLTGELEIPDGVTSIGSSAFESCLGLTTINYKGTVEQWNAITFGTNWNEGTSNYTIYCTDGTLSKS